MIRYELKTRCTWCGAATEGSEEFLFVGWSVEQQSPEGGIWVMPPVHALAQLCEECLPMFEGQSFIDALWTPPPGEEPPATDVDPDNPSHMPCVRCGADLGIGHDFWNVMAQTFRKRGRQIELFDAGEGAPQCQWCWSKVGPDQIAAELASDRFRRGG